MKKLNQEDLKRKKAIEDFLEERTSINSEKSLEELIEASSIIKQLNDFSKLSIFDKVKTTLTIDGVEVSNGDLTDNQRSGYGDFVERGELPLYVFRDSSSTAYEIYFDFKTSSLKSKRA